MNKVELLLHLNELNIKKIELEFSGGGDSGDINDIYYYDSLKDDAKAIDMCRINNDVDDFIKKIVDNILTEIEDWWNNDGGGGIMTINVPDMTYNIQNYIIVQSQHEFSHEGELEFKEE